MVSHLNENTFDIVRQGLTGLHQADELTLASATLLAERLERVNQLGGAFEQVSFSPQMQAMMAGQLAEYAV